jgi:hypothetical protein
LRFGRERFSDFALGMADVVHHSAGNVEAADPADKQLLLVAELAAVGSSAGEVTNS